VAAKAIGSVDELVTHLRDTGDVLYAPEQPREAAPDRSLLAEGGPKGDWLLSTSKPALSEDDDWGAPGGLRPRYGQLLVSEDLYQALCKEIQDDCSAVRRHSSRPIERAFVFVDVSDFSKLASGVQLLVVLALIRLAADAQKDVRAAEAQLCIGDGYIYVFKDAAAATFFASCLARMIEEAVAGATAPDFHFRIGVHAGLVRCFWDPGRKDWNYVGDGINGAQRVLGAIGKETDDVVYVSAQVRQHILRSDWSGQVLATLDNKGRKADKHGKPWRVYQVNHIAFFTGNYHENPSE
jgi:class 3 adenylate cyclase